MLLKANARFSGYYHSIPFNSVDKSETLVFFQGQLVYFNYQKNKIVTNMLCSGEQSFFHFFTLFFFFY